MDLTERCTSRDADCTPSLSEAGGDPRFREAFGHDLGTLQDNVRAHILGLLVTGNLSRGERRNLNPSAILDYLLTLEAAPDIVARLDPEDNQHRRLVRGDLLAALIFENPDRAKWLVQRYEEVMYPYICRVHESVLDPKSSLNSFPEQFYSGVQGGANARMVVRCMMDEIEEFTADDLEQLIGQGVLDMPLFRKNKLAGLIACVKVDSLASFLIDQYFSCHPDPEYRARFANLRPYHFPQVNFLWTKGGDGREEMPAGWEYDAENKQWRNLGLARTAIGELIDHLMDNPGRKDLGIDEYLRRMEALIPAVTDVLINTTEIGYSRTLGGPMTRVYGRSTSAAIIDYLQNHPTEAVREHFRGLKPYHFQCAANWERDWPDALAETMEILMDPEGSYGWKLADMPRLLSQQALHNIRLRFGSGLLGMLNRFGDSPYEVFKAYIAAHPDPAVRESFAGLRPYHFRNVPHGSWYRSSEPPAAEMSEWKFDDDSKGWIHISYAREALAEFFGVLTSPSGGRRLCLSDIPQEVTMETFDETQIAFGATLPYMIDRVYKSSACLALMDFIQSNEFGEFLKGRPDLQAEIRDKWGGVAEYSEYARGVLEARRGFRGLTL